MSTDLQALERKTFRAGVQFWSLLDELRKRLEAEGYSREEVQQKSKN